MEQDTPHYYLKSLPLTDVQFHPITTSTNDDALAWIRVGVKEPSVVIADQQSQGRGRGDHGWVTQPGSSLAFSLILHPTEAEVAYLTRFTALAALALVKTLHEFYGIQAEIKWPNDVLLDGKKTAGILVELQWDGDLPTAIVIGMGVNVNQGSNPPDNNTHFPATCIEEVYGQTINRWELLSRIIKAMLDLRSLLPTTQFILEWNAHLAFRGRVCPVQHVNGETQVVRIVRVAENGALLVDDLEGKLFEIQTGEIGSNNIQK